MVDPRWTVVTGASGGLGAEFARLYAAEGRSLVLAARSGDRLDALAAELGGGALVRTVAVDLGTADGPGRLVAALGDLPVHTLVNNAGFGLQGRFAALPEDGQLAMLDLNIRALTELARRVLPGMVARRAGGILNVASTASFQPVPTMAVYAATKAYVLSFSEALHEEARRQGVVVTAFCPGPTRTDFAARAGMDGSKLFARAMDARTVARLGVAGHAAGRAVVVAGAANRVGSVAVRLLPRGLIRRAVGRMGL